jgi:DNA-binding NtrC family response regulator
MRCPLWGPHAGRRWVLPCSPLWGPLSAPRVVWDEERLDVPKEMSLPEILEDLERQLILKAFKKAGGVKTETARLLGIKTSALYYKLDKYEVS